jgi:hypothetical protein
MRTRYPQPSRTVEFFVRVCSVWSRNDCGSSRPIYYSDGSDGHTGNWVDGTALRQTGADLQEYSATLPR